MCDRTHYDDMIREFEEFKRSADKAIRLGVEDMGRASSFSYDAKVSAERTDATIKEMSKTMMQHRIEDQATKKELFERIGLLEKFNAKVVGIAIAVGTFVSALGMGIKMLWDHLSKGAS